LSIQAARGDLDPSLGPAARITFASVSDFFEALRAAGNVDNTIKARLFHLRMALHVMVPGTDFNWITRPGDASLDSLLVQAPDDAPPPASSAVLFKWGMGLMPDAPLPDQKFKKIAFCRVYRDGLIIALLASRAPRIGSLAQMRMESCFPSRPIAQLGHVRFRPHTLTVIVCRRRLRAPAATDFLRLTEITIPGLAA
jgi:hypothetical protein